MSSNTHSDGSGSITRSVLSRDRPERRAHRQRDDVGDERLGRRAADRVVGNATPQRKWPGLRAADGLEGDPARREAPLEVIEEAPGDRLRERLRHRLAVLR
jgi:hypothetical protein